VGEGCQGWGCQGFIKSGSPTSVSQQEGGVWRVRGGLNLGAGGLVQVRRARVKVGVGILNGICIPAGGLWQVGGTTGRGAQCGGLWMDVCNE
jgi:hypothetical protein